MEQNVIEAVVEGVALDGGDAARDRVSGPREAKAQAAKELLGAFAGVLVSDRWNAYNFIEPARRQLCWAHLLRDFEWIAEFGGEAKEIGRALVDEAKRVFRLWHMLKERRLARSGFEKQMRPVMARVEALLDEGAGSGAKKARTKVTSAKRTCL